MLMNDSDSQSQCELSSGVNSQVISLIRHTKTGYSHRYTIIHCVLYLILWVLYHPLRPSHHSQTAVVYVMTSKEELERVTDHLCVDREDRISNQSSGFKSICRGARRLHCYLPCLFSSLSVSVLTVVPPLKVASYCSTPCGVPQNSMARYLSVSHCWH